MFGIDTCKGDMHQPAAKKVARCMPLMREVRGTRRNSQTLTSYSLDCVMERLMIQEFLPW
jgi:hypothetical protein